MPAAMPTPATLEKLLPAKGEKLSPDDLLSRFLEYCAARGLELYPAQEEAILELFAGKHVVLGTPTGSGSRWWPRRCTSRGCARQGQLLHLPDQGAGQREDSSRSARSSARQRGMMTGDASVNRLAPIVCCTAEILSNLALREEAPSSTTS
jgi:superfamily II RNA helicase